MVTLVFAVLLYISTATTVMRWLPAVRVKRFATWSFHFWYFFTPSIQTSRRWIPAGELPLALTSTGDATLAFAPGPQTFAAKFAAFGGAQFVKALVFNPTSTPEPR